MRLLPKKTGYRFREIRTYCFDNEIVGKETIKSAQESGMGSNEFVHVIKSNIKKYDKPVVVKIHESNSIYIKKELLAMKELTNFKNIAKSICNFSCIDNKLRWESPINHDVKFCNQEKDNLHFFVYEYIENGDIEEYFNSMPNVHEIKTIFLQTALTIMTLGKEYNIIHGDLNSGNILFSKTDKKTVSYMLDEKKYIINTHGRMPKLIDFGRCKKINGNASEYAMDDVFIMLDVLTTWIKNEDLKEKLRHFLLHESNKNSLNFTNFMSNLTNFFMVYK